jgi:hypothetical protein
MPIKILLYLIIKNKIYILCTVFAVGDLGGLAAYPPIIVGPVALWMSTAMRIADKAKTFLWVVVMVGIRGYLVPARGEWGGTTP